MVSTLKHFVGYSAARAGRNLAPVSINAASWRTSCCRPSRTALRAGARSVMSAYVDLDGVAVVADPEILRDCCVPPTD
jgi:beta-xylosidase